MSRILLDTCALIWLGNGQNELSLEARDAISKAGEVFVSPISLWEISNKCRQGKLLLKMPVRDWFDALFERHSLSVFPLSVEDMILSGELPEHHKDPADRMIIASAPRSRMPVVTTDRNFPKYGVQTIKRVGTRFSTESGEKKFFTLLSPPPPHLSTSIFTNPNKIKPQTKIRPRHCPPTFSTYFLFFSP